MKALYTGWGYEILPGFKGQVTWAPRAARTEWGHAATGGTAVPPVPFSEHLGKWSHDLVICRNTACSLSINEESSWDQIRVTNAWAGPRGLCRASHCCFSGRARQKMLAGWELPLLTPSPTWKASIRDFNLKGMKGKGFSRKRWKPSRCCRVSDEHPWMKHTLEKMSLHPTGVLSHSSRARLFVAPWTVAHQAPLSLGFSGQEYWSG